MAELDRSAIGPVKTSNVINIILYWGGVYIRLRGHLPTIRRALPRPRMRPCRECTTFEIIKMASRFYVSFHPNFGVGMWFRMPEGLIFFKLCQVINLHVCVLFRFLLYIFHFLGHISNSIVFISENIYFR